MAVCALVSGVTRCAAQDSGINIGTADYLNFLYVPTNNAVSNVTGVAQGRAVAFFGGNISAYTNAPTENSSRANRLVSSAFGFPVTPTPLRKPDVDLGDEIRAPQGFTNFVGLATNSVLLSNSVFYVTTNGVIHLYAADPGYVTLLWSNSICHCTTNQTVLISSLPTSNAVTVAIYHTETNGVATGAPTVDVGPATVFYHPNASVPQVSLWKIGNALHASNSVGRILLEVWNASSTVFLGAQVLEVRRYQANVISTNVGSFLAPQQTVSEPVRQPYLSPFNLGLAGPANTYYAYRYSNGASDPHDGDVFATQPTPGSDQIEVFWRNRGLGGIVWPYEMDHYEVHWPANFAQISRRIYLTEGDDDTPTRAPFVHVDASAAPNVTIHYNGAILPNLSSNGTNSSMWLQSATRDLHAKHYSGRVLLHYHSPAPAEFIGAEYVEVVPYERNFLDAWHIGDRLLPTTNYDTNPLKPLVTRGVAPDSPVFVYQHSDPMNQSPNEGQIFAIRQTTTDSQIEVFWKRRGSVLPDMEWPYEMHRYTATWPTNDSAKFQRYVRGTSPLGTAVAIPARIRAERMEYQDPANHATLAGNTFSTIQPGWSLLKYSFTNDFSIAFQVVRSILHTDPLFDLSLRSTNIGTEIIEPLHQGYPPEYKPGFIYVPTANSHDWDRFDESIYTNFTGQIFPVNKGKLEVWWWNTNKTVQWPSLVKRYTNNWPQAENIVIASQKGSRPINPTIQSNYNVYAQNDATKPGFNPNDEHALFRDNGDGQAVYALRSDLGRLATSDPYVLLKYQSPADNSRWRFTVYRVLAEGTSWDGANYTFNYPGTAGTLVQPPFPLSVIDMPPSPQNTFVSGPAWLDRKGYHWARAAGNLGPTDTADIVMRWFYPVQPGFYFPDDYLSNLPVGVQSNQPPIGVRVPWLDLYNGNPGIPKIPHNITYRISWPSRVPTLLIGETLVKRKFGLPDIQGQTSVEIIYQQGVATGEVYSVRLIDPTWDKPVIPVLGNTDSRQVFLSDLPGDVQKTKASGLWYFPNLPPHLRNRFWYNPNSQRLHFKGQFVETPAGIEEPIGYLLLNVISARDSNRLVNLSNDPAYRSAVNDLCRQSSAVIDAPPDGPFDSLALTAGYAKAAGFVTLAFANSPVRTTNNPSEPVALAVIRVDCPTYRGDLEVIYSEDPFDEKLTLRQSGDFAGRADDYIFDWRTEPPVNGLPSTKSGKNWSPYSTVGAEVPDGRVDITIQGPGLYTLTDNYFICRYKPKRPALCGAGADLTDPVGWSEWTRPQLAEGWIKRVVNGINPFEQKQKNFHGTSIDTRVSMMSIIGPPSIGSVPLNVDAANSLGLAEIYQTVLTRGRELSIEGTPPINYGPANDALLLVASRIADFYMLLGNEAYADGADPTIGITYDPNTVIGAESSSLHCFMNQTTSLLEEELALLRGRDDRLLPPVETYPFYNRLIWNFTGGAGEVAYALNYGIASHDSDGTINEVDAKVSWPQGHGDAWGHYLTAIKSYYRLLRHTNFTWIPRIEAVLVGGVPVSVDYLDERKFAQIAAALARTGSEIVNLTYRDAYVENPNGQWQGYLDSYTDRRNESRAWGLAEWGSRVGQGTFFNWVVGNAILPETYREGHKITSQTLNQVGMQADYHLTDAVITNIFGAAILPGSWRLAANDLIGLPSLATKLKLKADGVSAYLNGRFAQSTRQTLANYGGTADEQVALRNILVPELNTILGGVLIYDVQRFAGVSYSQETLALLAQAPQGDELARLNRLLLDDAYPVEVSRQSAGVADPLVQLLEAMPLRQFHGRDSIIAALDNRIGTNNRVRFQGAILGGSQTNGLPEHLYATLELLAGNVYPSSNALYFALQQTLGTNEVNLYYPSIIRPNIEVPSGQVPAGIQKIDRSTVPQLREVASAYQQIQAEVDKADLGVNPLGLAKNVIPFDIDPSGITQGKTHFEQIYDRAVQSMNNCITVFNHANNATQMLRRQADSVQDFRQKVFEREGDFTNRLIEIFGYPYPEDIGPTGSYPSGYDGPDTENLHYNYVDLDKIEGFNPPPNGIVMQSFVTSTVNATGGVTRTVSTVPLSISTERLELQKPTGWTKRRAPGEIQRALGELVQNRIRFLKALEEYNNLVEQIQDQAELMQAQHGINADEIHILDQGRDSQRTYSTMLAGFRATEMTLRDAANSAHSISDAAAEFLPGVVGVAVDVTSGGRGALRIAGAITGTLLNATANAIGIAELGVQNAKEDAQAANNIDITTSRQLQGITNQIAQLRQIVRQEPAVRYELFTLKEALGQAVGNYSAILARGERIIEERQRFRVETAAQTQEYRYKDMAFRIFRDDALQKYRAQFDLAARYVFLAAAAYDFETCLLPGDPRGPGQDFMTDIIRTRAIGLIGGNGQPLTGTGVGDAGLADPLARMYLNWTQVLRSQLGFNNPQTETGRFSLRSELFRAQTNATAAAASAAWREVLGRSVVTNLWELHDYLRYCIPFSTNRNIAEPAIVIGLTTPFASSAPGEAVGFGTTVTSGENFFGWPAGGGDNTYDTTHFATKIRSVGVWFANYNNTGLINTPHVYLIPIGSDVFRSPTGGFGVTREWKILDQLLPVPFPLSGGELTDPTWIPVNDTLSDELAAIRRYPTLRAYHDSGNFSASETINDSRLIGRSVWNTRWLLIIPGVEIGGANRNEGIQRFIYGQLVNGQRNNNGVSDIKIFFQTYSYSGN